MTDAAAAREACFEVGAGDAGRSVKRRKRRVPMSVRQAAAKPSDGGDRPFNGGHRRRGSWRGLRLQGLAIHELMALPVDRIRDAIAALALPGAADEAPSWCSARSAAGSPTSPTSASAT